MNSMGIHKKTILQAKKSVIHGLGCLLFSLFPKVKELSNIQGPG